MKFHIVQSLSERPVRKWTRRGFKMWNTRLRLLRNDARAPEHRHITLWSQKKSIYETHCIPDGAETLTPNHFRGLFFFLAFLTFAKINNKEAERHRGLALIEATFTADGKCEWINCKWKWKTVLGHGLNISNWSRQSLTAIGIPFLRLYFASGCFRVSNQQHLQVLKPLAEHLITQRCFTNRIWLDLTKADSIFGQGIA